MPVARRQSNGTASPPPGGNSQREPQVIARHIVSANEHAGNGKAPVGLLVGLGGAGEPNAFPLGAYPPPIRAYVESIARALPCPVDFPGSMILPVLSTFIGRKRCISIKSGWVEYPLLWVACVGKSGDRKTPAFSEVTEPLRARQRMMEREYKHQLHLYRQLDEEARKVTDEPVQEQILTNDATVEALKDVLAGNPNGIIYPADELSGWVRGLAQYKSGNGNDRQHWLSIWSGMQIVCNRRSQKAPIIIDNPFVSVVGGIQPDMLQDFIDEDCEDGWAARMLYSFPEPIKNADWTEDTVEGGWSYKRVCERLWNLEPMAEPHAVASDAKALWVEWVNHHRKENPNDELRASWSKAEGHSLRIALILHLLRQACGETKSVEVENESILGAIQIIEYFKEHAKKVFNHQAGKKDDEKLLKAQKWAHRMIAKGKKVTARQAQMSGVAGVKKAEEAHELLQMLAEAGYGTFEYGLYHPVGSIPPPNPTNNPTNPTNPTTQQGGG